MGEKMTENEIITAWECCSNVITSSCKECPLHLTYNANCVRELMRVSLDLFNRQKAENERLKRHNKEYGFCNLLGNCLVYSKNLKDYNDMRKGLKSEAYMEFAERLKNKSKKRVSDNYGKRIFIDDIDTTLKELTKKKDLEV